MQLNIYYVVAPNIKVNIIEINSEIKYIAKGICPTLIPKLRFLDLEIFRCFFCLLKVLGLVFLPFQRQRYVPKGLFGQTFGR